MKGIKLMKAIQSIVILGVVFSCVQDDNFTTPTVTCIEPELTATTTIQQVKEMYIYGAPTVIDTDIIIEGYVVSSDKSGNIYKSISIQDKPKNPTAAIKIAIDETNLYTKYNIGRKIYVKLKGLAVGYSYGSIQIGKASGSSLEKIASFEVDNHIIRSCEVVEIVPKEVTLSELNDTMLEMLIKIKNVQFKDEELGNTYANTSTTQTVDRYLEEFSANCDFSGTITVRNSGYSSFKNELLPEGKGTIIAIYSNYYNNYQLYIRDTNDLNFTETRCSTTALQSTISISEIRALYSGTMVEFGIENNYVMEGYVISSDQEGNFRKKIVLQDAIENPLAGIQILVDDGAIFENYAIGDKVFVKLDRLYMAQKDEILSIGYPNGTTVTEIPESDISDFLFNSNENFQLTPKQLAISETSNPTLENTLVRVQNVQLVEDELGMAYTYFSGVNEGVRLLETCNNPARLGVFTYGEATFSNSLFPEGHGTITGVLAGNLQMRNLTDIQFTEPYEDCPVVIPKIMITEVADPNNSTSSRFVELYNAGDTAINLTGWKLNKYVNGSTSVSSSGVDLTGIIIEASAFVIIANTGYAATFLDTPTVETTYISGNGDDAYELVNSTGEVIDIYGVIGEDGTGTNWEYLDGRAVRNTTVSMPNTVFSANEWTIYTASSNTQVSFSNAPQNAPEDFNPRMR